MKKEADILVIIPCYNEESCIQQVVNELIRVRNATNIPFDILAINDCSTDRTKEVLETLDCQYLDLSINLGIGGAMHTGYRYAHKYQYQVAVQMDGDGQHPARELPKLLKPILDGRADVVIGSRFLNKEGFQSTALRRIGITYFAWLNRLLIGKRIADSTSGFRAFNRRAISIVNTYYPDEYPEPEAIVLFGHHKLTIVEVPVIMSERLGGVSSIRAWKSLYYMLKVSLGCFFTYIRLKF